MPASFLSVRHWQLRAVELAPGASMQRVSWSSKHVVLSITGRQPYKGPVYRLDNEKLGLLYEHELPPALQPNP